MSKKEQQRKRDVSRRGVLQGTAIAGATAFAGTAAGDYREVLENLDEPRVAAQNDDAARTFSLVGIVGGWLGVEPAEIDGQSGPTLRLMEGEEHTIYWTNGDGSGHNFVILGEDGDALEGTSMTDELGETTELTFTAEPEMEQYLCQPHPVQMRGPIEVIDPEEVSELHVLVEDGNGNPLGAEVFLDQQHTFSDIAARPDPDIAEDEESAENGEDDAADDEDLEDPGDEEAGPEYEEAVALARFDMLEDGEYTLEAWTYGHERVTEEVSIDGDDEEVTLSLDAVEPDEPTETFELRLEEDEWVGVAPDEIADESNPTLELEAEETYAVEWENGIGRLEDEERWGEPLPGHNFAIATGGETNTWNTHVRSEFTDEEGDTQSVEFVAKAEMGTYLDQSQLDAVGEVVVDGEAVEAEDEADEPEDAPDDAEPIDDEADETEDAPDDAEPIDDETDEEPEADDEPADTDADADDEAEDDS